MVLRQLARRVAVAAGTTTAGPAARRGAAAPVALTMRGIASSRPRLLGATDYPFEQPREGTSIEDGTEHFTAPGAPWTPNPTAEDYEETVNILLESKKVEAAVDIFGRMLKRGHKPTSQLVDAVYQAAKAKPEWQAAAVKALAGAK